MTEIAADCFFNFLLNVLVNGVEILFVKIRLLPALAKTRAAS
jgi:hypothetical protein